MTPTLLSAVAVLAAYLIGAVPFGYLVAKGLKGVDIRTVGSGNIGATNVGRVLGFRFFVLVFTFDVLKGFLPTWGAARVVAALAGAPAPPDLPVLAALASILGHNFPIYLGFKGGKGVATSLGAMFALDPTASAASAVGFGLSLIVCKYVSLSSIIGGVVFAVAHFATVGQPWTREQRAMSLLTLTLLVLLVVRHRKNFARIRAGTEPKVRLRRKDAPAGRIAVGWLLALALGGVVAVVVVSTVVDSLRARPLTIGSYTFREADRAGTGHQRAERVAFADGGKLLAVTCPRYNRLVLYAVTDVPTLEPLHDIELEGKPVAVRPTADRLLVLQRPPGDRRHVEPGWWESFDFQGKPIGDRVPVGFYPDDLGLSRDGRFAFVLTSGRAEGGAERPPPALEVFEVATGTSLGRVAFDGQGDDPSHLELSASGRCAAVTLLGSNAVASLDLGDPTRPRVIGRTPLPNLARPYSSRDRDDCVIMPVAGGGESVLLPLAGFGDCLASTLPHGSGLEVTRADAKSLGRLTLRSGKFGTAATRPTGLAYAPDRGLIAVANRSGGVHLVTVRTTGERLAAVPDRAPTTRRN